jgi:hypothetical protein
LRGEILQVLLFFCGVLVASIEHCTAHVPQPAASTIVPVLSELGFLFDALLSLLLLLLQCRQGGPPEGL